MVELMFAIGVFLVAIVAAYASQVTSADLVSTSRETKVAVAELRTAMEELLGEPFDDLAVDYPDGQTIPAYDDRVLEGQRIQVVYPAPGADPLEIQLVMSWNDFRGRPRNMTMSSMRTR